MYNLQRRLLGDSAMIIVISKFRKKCLSIVSMRSEYFQSMFFQKCEVAQPQDRGGELLTSPEQPDGGELHVPPPG